MKRGLNLIAGILGLMVAASGFAAEALQPQRLLYIGDRSGDYVPFLKEHFAKVDAVSLWQLQPGQAKDYDVVLLDWPQHMIMVNGKTVNEWDQGVPLGKREEWSKPTVLLGSAGLNVAVAWKLKGGSGCTCLAPVAYNVREHEIFKGPMPVNTKALVTIPTPAGFKADIKAATVEVLPLVDNIKKYDTVIDDYQRGWATHYFEFADLPEVEIFCGGINEQTPASGAFWRQGNLLHFGFEQSPKQLNETGRAMLVNGIAYISRFSEDRPIDITPSVFGNDRIGISRRRARNLILNDDSRLDWLTNNYAAATLAKFNWHDRAAAKAWVLENGQWLHPGKDNFLEVDEEAKALGVAFDAADFLPKTIAALRVEATRTNAATVLARYVAELPSANPDAAAWVKWWRENGNYVFYSELGGYKWYVDPLAKKRGVPTKELRGAKRAG